MSWDEPVCAACFGDDDLAQYIRDVHGKRGCHFCGRIDAPTAPLEEVASHMRGCLSEFYGAAVEQLPYESAEGGYQGQHWDTYELVLDVLGLDLPRDDEQLALALCDSIGDDLWCDYDWLALDLDDALAHAWQKLCRTIQHERRFFFAAPTDETAEQAESYVYHPDNYTPLALLAEIVKLIEEYDLIEVISKGSVFFRCRPTDAGTPFVTAADLGPPPASQAIQANRMNPPGIP